MKACCIAWCRSTVPTVEYLVSMTAQAVLPPLSSEIRKSGEYQALSVSLSVSAASALRGLTDQRVVLASPMPFSGSTFPAASTGWYQSLTISSFPPSSSFLLKMKVLRRAAAALSA